MKDVTDIPKAPLHRAPEQPPKTREQDQKGSTAVTMLGNIMTAGARVHTNLEATRESWLMLLNGLYLVFYSYLCVLCVCARMKGMCHFICFPISCSDYSLVCNGEHGAGAWRQACLAA